MATSYSNIGGSGDRRSLIRIFHNAVLVGGFFNNPEHLLDGASGSSQGWFESGKTDAWLDFDFSAIGRRVVDGFRIYGSSATNNGTWRVLGWNGTGWDELLASFTFAAGSGYGSPNEITFANTTPYSVYRLEQIGGTTTNSPDYSEIEFRIEDTGPSAPIAWGNTGGVGDRTSVISMSSNLGLGSGGFALNNLIDGSISAQGWFAGGESDRYIDFDLSAMGAQVIDAFVWRQSNATAHGTWRLLGWNGASWDALMSAETLRGFSGSGGFGPMLYRVGNVTAYVLYRLEQTSGTTSNDPNLAEIEFRLGGSPEEPSEEPPSEEPSESESEPPSEEPSESESEASSESESEPPSEEPSESESEPTSEEPSESEPEEPPPVLAVQCVLVIAGV